MTIDGFTVKGGTQAYSASNPQEHVIWVHANYSTIKNNTIIGARGTADIYIGGRTTDVPTGAIWGYQVSTPIGHTIQNNSFRNVGSGEGWGIFAYDLTNSLITGNQFVGDAADVGTWNVDEGAPGTGIIIHKATAGTGSVVIENNTAHYLKYTFLTFYAAYPYNDSVGKMYEQPEASTVDKVIVRNNAAYYCGTDASHTSGTGVNFHRAKKDDAYGIKFADLTVGSALVTIGPGNQFYTNAYGIKIDDPSTAPSYVVGADNIFINNNSIYSNTSYGAWNGTKDNGGGGGGPVNVDATYNWWGNSSGPDDDGGTNPTGTGDKISTCIIPFTPWLQCSVTAPNGGECIKGGITHTVRWTSYSVTGAQATIDLYNGSTYTTLGQKSGLTNGANTLDVTMPSINNTTCKIRVTISGGGGPSYSAMSATNFWIDNGVPSVSLGALPSTCLKGGTPINLTFVASDTGSTGPTSLQYLIEYSPTGTTPWTSTEPAFSGAPGSITRSWTPTGNSNICKWRVTATDCANNPTTATSGSFTIDSTNPTAVAVILPNGGETLTAGGTYVIQWNATDNLPGNLNYTLRYDTASGTGGYTNLIAGPFSGIQGTNYYTWPVPYVAFANRATCRVQVTAADCATNSTPDASNADFTIQSTTAPTVTIAAPNGGQTWRAGSPQTISWTATDLLTTSTMQYDAWYCTDYSGTSGTWIPIVGAGLSTPGETQGAKTFTWTPVPTPLSGVTSNQSRVKIKATDQAGNFSEQISANNFTIIVDTVPAVTVTLTSLNGGSVQGGTAQTISWTATTTVPSDTLTIVLEYSSTGTFPGTNIVTLNNRAQTTLVPGCFCWAVPTTPTTSTYKVKVVASVTGSPSLTASATSANAFTVSAVDPDWGIITSAPINLKTGWNLMSLTLIPTCCPSAASGLTTTCTCTHPIEGVLASVLDKVDRVWYYNNTGSSATWIGYKPGSPGALTRMEDGKAYWVYVTADCPLTFQGRKSAWVLSPPPSYSTVAGWNMVGYKDTGSTRTVQQYLGTPCPSTIYSLPIYEQALFGSPGWTLIDTCGATLKTGYGYWVYYNSAGTFRALE